MSRLLAIGMIVAALSTTGCVGWGPCGNECFRGPFRGMMEGLCSTCGDECCNCDGYNPPFGSLRKRLACGSGCGEIYYGEWRSNPPNPCNDCDVRGAVGHGACLRFPWLTYMWRPWGIQYRPNGWGYGNPYRASHTGWSDYGYRPGMLLQGACGDPCCPTGCDSGCATGDCSPKHVPAGSRLRPVPAHSAQHRIGSSGATQVNYESPLVRASRIRSVAAKREVMATQPVSSEGRLKKQKSLR